MCATARVMAQDTARRDVYTFFALWDDAQEKAQWMVQMTRDVKMI